MKNILFSCIAMFFFCISHVFILGCVSRSPSSKFYTLTTIQKTETQQPAEESLSRISVKLVPVDIPDYLDRPQIITRKAKNQLKRAEFDRWGGSLKENIYTVLRENLSVLLSAEKAAVLFWESPANYEYRLTVKIIRFEAMPRGTVQLKARWTILEEKGKKIVSSREASFDETIDGQGYAEIVGAMSTALEALSRQIAKEIISLVHYASER